MVNPFVKKKRNTVTGSSVGGFAASYVLMFIGAVLSSPLAELFRDILGTNYYLTHSFIAQFNSFFQAFLVILFSFGSILIVNSTSRKAGKPEACVSPAYGFIVYAILHVFQTLLNYISFVVYNKTYYGFASGFNLVSTILILILTVILGIVAYNAFFKEYDRRTAAIREKVKASKEAEAPVSAERKTFTVNRIIVLAVFVVGYILHKVVSYFTNTLFTAISTVVFFALSVAAVCICNKLCNDNQKPEDTLPGATIFVPLGVGLISSVFVNLFSSIIYFINSFTADSYGYDEHYHIASDLSKITPVIVFVIGLISIIVFTLLIFRHEDKQFKTLLENGYYEKEEEVLAPNIKLPAYQQPVQPVYQQPVQPVYQQPVQPVYQQPVQPVYQQPVQPVYQQPVQPVYQQPVQPVYQQPVQPVYQQPVQPVYQQPVQPVYQQPVQPVYQQPVQPVYQQPVQPVPQAPAEPVVAPEDKTVVAPEIDGNR